MSTDVKPRAAEAPHLRIQEAVLSDIHDSLIALDVELSALSALTDPKTPQGKLSRHCAMLAAQMLEEIERELTG